MYPGRLVHVEPGTQRQQMLMAGRTMVVYFLVMKYTLLEFPGALWICLRWTYFVWIDKVDVCCSVDDDIHLGAKIVVVFLTHPHVHQTNIT